MVAKPNTVNIPAGMKKVDDATFHKFEKPGDSFHGIFRGTKESKSAMFGNMQTVWICSPIDDVDAVVLISEKETMKTKRTTMKEGQAFFLVYEGEKESNTKGRKPYKIFSLYVDETPF